MKKEAKDIKTKYNDSFELQCFHMAKWNFGIPGWYEFGAYLENTLNVIFTNRERFVDQ